MISETREYVLKNVRRAKMVIDIASYFRLRKKIKPLDNEWVFFCPAHAGDTYIFCCLSQAFIDKYGGYMTVITPKAYSSIPKLFPSISRILVYKKFPPINIGRFFMDVITENNKDKIRQRAIWGFPSEIYIPIAGYKGLRFVDAFKMFLGLDPEAKLIGPTISDDLRDRAFKRFREFDLPFGSTVVLAPYAKSSLTLSMDNWAKIIEEMKKAGLYPVTNVGRNESPLPGTRGITVPFDEILPFSEFAGHVISSRSGLCDILATSRAKLTIIYLQQKFGQTSFYEYTSLKLNGLAGQEANIQELVCENNENRVSVIEQTINFHING